MRIYRFHMVCPVCDRDTVWTTDDPKNPRLNCGDCLVEKVEIVELKIVHVTTIVKTPGEKI